jgi:putative FmdB family regulatory protein
MPIYEYEPIDWDCPMCENRVAVIQGINEEPLKMCPQCGMEVRRVISKVSIQIKRPSGAGKAAAKGFTTWRKVGQGEYEKVDGPGVDAIIASEQDKKAVAEEKAAPKKIVDLDKP